MPLSSSPHSSLHSPGGGSRTSFALSRADEADSSLFNPPADLVCPLTLSVFLDPVLTSAGHVYERSAITSHLERSSTDPLTRTPLINKSLTPVFVLRSRALEYRESAAKSCIERLCGSGASGGGAGAASDPVRYLRRAVELVADSGGCVQGLSPATVEYVLAHPSNAFDGLCLQVFAEGLLLGGYRDRAAAIYASLLLLEGEAAADRATQAELLRRCLSCWTDGSDSTGSYSGGGQACSSSSSSSQMLSEVTTTTTTAAVSTAGAVAAQAVDEYVFEKLVALFEGRGSVMLVELAQHAALGDRFVLRLCEQLLFHPPPSAGDFPGPRELFGGDGGSDEKRLLLKYVHVLTDSLQRRQSETERRLAELERWRGGRQRSDAGSGASGRLGGGSGGAQGGRGLLLLPAWARHPAVVAVLLVLTLGLPSDQPVGRVLRAAPYLALLPAAAAGGDGGGAKGRAA